MQPLQMELLQAVAFSNVIDSLKAMSLTPHAWSKLKSLDYGAIIIEYVNCLPTLMVTYYFSFLLLSSIGTIQTITRYG
jgi:hypothetical protein